MNVEGAVTSDRQLVRLLQMGVVLEEVVEARASKHYESLAADDDAEVDPAIAELLADARAESADHRQRLEGLIDRFDADTIPFDRIQGLVEEQWGQAPPGSFDDVLYDQLHGEESAYKFYDDLIAAIEDSEAAFDVDRELLLSTLAGIRDEEAEGVRDVTELMSGEP